jgi:hypothetical protein
MAIINQDTTKMKKIHLCGMLLSILVSGGVCFGADETVLDGQKIFPLTSWGSLSCQTPSKETQIKLGFCDVDIEADDSATKFKGHSINGKKWEVDLGSTTLFDQCVLNVYCGDLSNNGMKDLVFEYSYPNQSGVAASGNANLLFVLFDKDGVPHPTEFFVHMPMTDVPFQNILQDSQGRAVLVHKELNKNENATCSCRASFYRVNGTDWEKIPIASLTVKNPTMYSSFSLTVDDRHFDSSDEALKLCSGKEGKSDDDFSSVEVTKYKQLKSYTSSDFDQFKFVLADEKNQDQKLDVVQYDSCYFIVDDGKVLKIFNHDAMAAGTFKALIKGKYHVNVVHPKNSKSYSLYFTKS